MGSFDRIGLSVCFGNRQNTSLDVVMKFTATIEFHMRDEDIEDIDDREIADMFSEMLERGVDYRRDEDESFPTIDSIVVKGDMKTFHNAIEE